MPSNIVHYIAEAFKSHLENYFACIRRIVWMGSAHIADTSQFKTGLRVLDSLSYLYRVLSPYLSKTHCHD